MRDWGQFTSNSNYNMLFPLAQNRLSDFAECTFPPAVKSIIIFGSACTHRFREFSDIDLIVVYDEEFNQMELYQCLKKIKCEYDIIMHKADIPMDKAFTPSFLKDINECSCIVYERS